MGFESIKGVIFDVHRTLVDDSGFPRERVWQLIKQAGVEFDMDEYYRLYDELTKIYFDWSGIKRFITVREIHRKRLQGIYQHFGVNRNIDEDLDYLWKCMKRSQIYPEVPEVLSVVSEKYKTALLSNADEDDPLIKILHDNGFSFDVVVTSHQLKSYKPNADLFGEVCKKLKLNRDQVIMVGDSPISDIIGAKNAGVKIVWLNRNQHELPPEFPKPDYKISNLKQLLSLLES